MAKSSKYVAKQADKNGVIHYNDEENSTWNTLITRQLKLIENRACDEYLEGLDALKLPQDRIPQLKEINDTLNKHTSWGVAEVPALISFEEFFKLLANKKFPVATFIRTREELDYLQEPDIFHEIFGHCPLLTNPSFAKFTETYGRLGLNASKQERVFLARLYWFTVEFGLIDTDKGMKIYGGGILSSKTETETCLVGENIVRAPLKISDTLRTPYRIDILQPIYFVINRLSELEDICKLDLMSLVREAMELGLYDPMYEPAKKAVNH